MGLAVVIEGPAEQVRSALDLPGVAHASLDRAVVSVGDTRAPYVRFTYVPVAMTKAQKEKHDALNQPIASLVGRSLKRPLTQVEFLRLMSYLTNQRIISNGLAQLQFEDLWPKIRGREPEEGLLKSLFAPKLTELRQLVREIALEQGARLSSLASGGGCSP